MCVSSSLNYEQVIGAIISTSHVALCVFKVNFYLLTCRQLNAEKCFFENGVIFGKK